MSDNTTKTSTANDKPKETEVSRSLLWPYVLSACILILGISILGMVWAAYWRFGFLCWTNSNVWCHSDYQCPAMHPINPDSDTPPSTLISQGSQPTTITKGSDGTWTSFGGPRPSIHYDQGFITKFSVNRCKYGLYEFINRQFNLNGDGYSQTRPVLCNCLAKYVRPEVGNPPSGSNLGADNNKYTGYPAFCLINDT
jgi:hypothetical protein